MPTLREAQEAILDLFTTATGIPITLYDFSTDPTSPEIVISPLSRKRFAAHCTCIQSLPGGKTRCENDQHARALAVLQSRQAQLTCCYAGMYNQVVPIIVDGEVKAVLSYGEIAIRDEGYQQRALERHQEAVKACGLTDIEEAGLRQLQMEAPVFGIEEFQAFESALQQAERLLYVLFEREAQLKRTAEDAEQVCHDIQIRLQGLIAETENLITDCTTLTPKELIGDLQYLLYSSLALDTVTQTLLGEYQDEYFFQEQPLMPLLYEAKQTFQAWAGRRGITIRVSDANLPTLEISRHHLQHALNNLVHNAVKYSFRSAPERRRFVDISGRMEDEYYVLEIENYGVGIRQEEIVSGAIFQEGYRGALTRREHRTGAGLGLPLVKRVIERHRGSIVVESRIMADETESDAGQPHLTRFIVHLPCRQPKKEQ